MTRHGLALANPSRGNSCYVLIYINGGIVYAGFDSILSDCFVFGFHLGFTGLKNDLCLVSYMSSVVLSYNQVLCCVLSYIPGYLHAYNNAFEKYMPPFL